jgi:hypothetical protein
MKWFWIVLLILTFAGPIWNMATGKVDFHADYRTANRESAHLAPDPKTTHEAVIQVYTARAFNWRGLIASHSWISVKPKDASEYTVYQVIGWRQFHGLPPLMIEKDIPDRNWYNEKPRVILDMRGDKAQALIPEIDAAAKAYPYANDYTLWPGPNSNTFPAYVARKVPQLGLVMPADAIGKDYLPNHSLFATAPSDTGVQLSLFGLLGATVAQKEGVEINLLGLIYGLRLSPFALVLPGWNSGT